VSPAHLEAASRVRALLATHRENEELIRLGAYKPGTDPEVDTAIAAMPEINAFLRQRVEDPTAFEESTRALARITQVQASPARGRKMRR
jgi:flagellum-specific ATP synthase